MTEPTKPEGSGWVQFGCHANPHDLDTPCAYAGPLEFADDGEDGLPNWERHTGALGVPCGFVQD